MFSLLSEYLLQYQKLSLPGIGTFEMTPKHAAAGYNIIEAAGWNIIFSEETPLHPVESNPDAFFQWLANRENISPDNAKLLFEEFSRNTLVKLNDHEMIHWEGLGTLDKMDDHIHFQVFKSVVLPFTDIHAQKIIRENATHNILVGEKETTSTVMREQILNDTPRNTYSKKATLLVLAAAILAIAIFLYNKGCNLQSAANQQKAVIQQSNDTYQIK